MILWIRNLFDQKSPWYLIAGNSYRLRTSDFDNTKITLDVEFYILQEPQWIFYLVVEPTQLEKYANRPFGSSFPQGSLGENSENEDFVGLPWEWYIHPWEWYNHPWNPETPRIFWWKVFKNVWVATTKPGGPRLEVTIFRNLPPWSFNPMKLLKVGWVSDFFGKSQDYPPGSLTASFPLKSYRNPIGKDRLPITIFQGRAVKLWGCMWSQKTVGKPRKNRSKTTFSENL